MDEAMRKRAVAMWRWRGDERPPFAEAPAPGQESVWDYPRPPRVEPSGRRVVVSFADTIVADTKRARRLLETASPPTWYLPLEDVRREYLVRAPGSSFCEWKGTSRYFHVRVEDRIAELAAWSYPRPAADYADLRDHVAFYPGRVHCSVDGETVRPQPGQFYGGWVTSDVVGPFKGEPGTGGW